MATTTQPPRTLVFSSAPGMTAALCLAGRGQGLDPAAHFSDPHPHSYAADTGNGQGPTPLPARRRRGSPPGSAVPSSASFGPAGSRRRQLRTGPRTGRRPPGHRRVARVPSGPARARRPFGPQGRPGGRRTARPPARPERDLRPPDRQREPGRGGGTPRPHCGPWRRWPPRPRRPRGCRHGWTRRRAASHGQQEPCPGREPDTCLHVPDAPGPQNVGRITRSQERATSRFVLRPARFDDVAAEVTAKGLKR